MLYSIKITVGKQCQLIFCQIRSCLKISVMLSKKRIIAYCIRTATDKNGRSRTKTGNNGQILLCSLHCRHTCCYYAGLYGIPLSIVQSIVGHMTPEMTKHYSAHASLSAKREQMRQLPEFMMLTGLKTRDFEAAEREELHRLISTLPIEKVRELLKELR